MCSCEEGLTDVSEDKDGSSCLRLTSVKIESIADVKRLSLVVEKPGVSEHALTISGLGNIPERWKTMVQTETDGRTGDTLWMSAMDLPTLIDMPLSREMEKFVVKFHLLVNATMLHVPDGTTLYGTLSLVPMANLTSPVVVAVEVMVQALASCEHSHFDVSMPSAAILELQGQQTVVRHDSKNVSLRALLKDVDGLVVNVTLTSVRYRMVWRPQGAKEVLMVGNLLKEDKADAAGDGKGASSSKSPGVYSTTIPLDLMRPGELWVQTELYRGLHNTTAHILGYNESMDSCFIKLASGFGTMQLFKVVCAPGSTFFAGECQTNDYVLIGVGVAVGILLIGTLVLVLWAVFRYSEQAREFIVEFLKGPVILALTVVAEFFDYSTDVAFARLVWAERAAYPAIITSIIATIILSSVLLVLFIYWRLRIIRRLYYKDKQILQRNLCMTGEALTLFRDIRQAMEDELLKRFGDGKESYVDEGYHNNDLQVVEARPERRRSEVESLVIFENNNMVMVDMLIELSEAKPRRVSGSQLRAGLKKIGLELSDAQHNIAMTTFDSGHKGQLDYLDLMTMLSPPYSKEQAELGKLVDSVKSTKTKKTVADTELLKLASDLMLAVLEDIPLGILGLLYLIYQYNVPVLLAVSLLSSGTMLGFKAGQIPLISVHWQKRTKYKKQLAAYETSARERERMQTALLASDKSMALGRKRSSLLEHEAKYNKGGLLRIPSMKQLSALSRTSRFSFAKKSNSVPPVAGCESPASSSSRPSTELSNPGLFDAAPESILEEPGPPQHLESSPTKPRPGSLRLLGNVLQRPLLWLGVDWGKGSVERDVESARGGHALPVLVQASSSVKLSVQGSVGGRQRASTVSARQAAAYLRRNSSEGDVLRANETLLTHPEVDVARSGVKLETVQTMDRRVSSLPSASKPAPIAKQHTPPRTRARAISIYSPACTNPTPLLGATRWRDRGTQVDGTFDGPKSMQDSAAQTDGTADPDSPNSTTDDGVDEAPSRASAAPNISLNLFVRMPSNQSLLDSSDFKMADSTIRLALKHLKGVNEWITRQGRLDPASAELILGHLTELYEQCGSSVELLGAVVSASPVRAGLPASVALPSDLPSTPPRTRALSAEHVVTVLNSVPQQSRSGLGLKAAVSVASAQSRLKLDLPSSMQPLDVVCEFGAGVNNDDAFPTEDVRRRDDTWQTDSENHAAMSVSTPLNSSRSDATGASNPTAEPAVLGLSHEAEPLTAANAGSKAAGLHIRKLITNRSAPIGSAPSTPKGTRIDPTRRGSAPASPYSSRLSPSLSPLGALTPTVAVVAWSKALSPRVTPLSTPRSANRTSRTQIAEKSGRTKDGLSKGQSRDKVERELERDEPV